MPLPPTIRVRLSSEAAEAISLTPVVVREIPITALMEEILAVAGKDEMRIREILRRGAVVSGASRFRWEGWDAEAEGLRELLATFPDSDPGRVFAAECCIRAVLRGGRRAIEIPREAGLRKPWLRRVSFWDALMEVVASPAPIYSGYSYRERADRYVREFTPLETDRLRLAAKELRYATLSQQAGSMAITGAELLVAR